jgi:2-C-methyl-D-erythritol 2,4-cyclodiphosphate synthase
MRIGLGYDAHAFIEGRPLILGGVRIPYEKGLLGHSDGDVLLHAISDALLSAAGADDIGVHFPNSDKSIEGLDSARILEHAAHVVEEKGYHVINIDAVVICEAPKIAGYREQIKERIAAVMGVEKDRVGIKGKTTEGMGFTGRREGVESYAVCLLSQEG